MSGQRRPASPRSFSFFRRNYRNLSHYIFPLVIHQVAHSTEGRIFSQINSKEQRPLWGKKRNWEGSSQAMIESTRTCPLLYRTDRRGSCAPRPLCGLTDCRTYELFRSSACPFGFPSPEAVNVLVRTRGLQCKPVVRVRYLRPRRIGLGGYPAYGRSSSRCSET